MNPSLTPQPLRKKFDFRSRVALLRTLNRATGPDAAEANPILQREVRARWRRWPAFVVVLLYASLLAGAVVYRYADLSRDLHGADETARLGHDLFVFLTNLQLFGWLLLAPLLTATSITTERERGTMLSLHLSRLAPYQIAQGKFFSALGFIVLLLLAPLPVVAVCFLLGGVTPWEFLGGFALQAATAAVGAAIGLACSARQARAGTAIGGALAIIALWNLVPPFTLVSPWFGSMLLINSQNDVGAVAVLILSCIFGLLGVVWLINDAAFALYRPLPPAALQNKVDPFSLPGATSPTDSPDTAPRPNPLGDFKRLPLVGRISFDNPVLQREIRVKLQVREGSLGSKGHTPSGLVAVLVVFFTCFAVFLVFGDSAVRYVTWNTFSYGWLIGSMGLATLWASNAFTREREAGMLSSLKLSLLTRGDILRGKAMAPLLALAYYSLALMPVLLPCLRGVSKGGGSQAPGVPLTQLAATCLIVLGASWLGTVLGLVWSWFARAGWAATAGAMGSGFFLLAGTLMGGGRNLLNKAIWWHPVVAQSFINNTPHQYLALTVAASQCLLWLGMGLLALIPIWVGLGRVTTETSQTRGS